MALMNCELIDGRFRAQRIGFVVKVLTIEHGLGWYFNQGIEPLNMIIVLHMMYLWLSIYNYNSMISM